MKANYNGYYIGKTFIEKVLETYSHSCGWSIIICFFFIFF